MGTCHAGTHATCILPCCDTSEGQIGKVYLSGEGSYPVGEPHSQAEEWPGNFCKFNLLLPLPET